MAGKIISHYKVLEKLGEGDMGGSTKHKGPSRAGVTYNFSQKSFDI